MTFFLVTVESRVDEAIATKHEARIRILNDDRRTGGRMIGQIEVHVVPEVEAEIIQGAETTKDRPEGYLEEAGVT